MAEVPDNDAVAHQLDVLRVSGAAERDPVRFAYLTALACRAGTQAEPIRQALNAKISRLADELAAGSTPAPTESAEPSASPLADLLAYINQHAHAQSDATPGKNETAAVNREIRPNLKSASARQTPSGPELRSVANYRNEWSRLSTEQQLTQTLAQAPENAGPMNSQHLILRSLQVMRDLAPDYLQGFMSYIDTLIWLDHADPAKPPAGRSSAGETEKKARPAKRSATKR